MRGSLVLFSSSLVCVLLGVWLLLFLAVVCIHAAAELVAGDNVLARDPLLWCIAVPMSSLTEGGDHRAPVAGVQILAWLAMWAVALVGPSER